MTDIPTPTPTETAAVAARPARRSGLRQSLPSMSGKLLAGLILIGAIVLFAVVGPWITQDPRSSGNDAMLPPQPGHWLGTTSLGYDVLAQLAEGARGSLIVGVTAGVVAIVLALLFGVVAGYLRGWTDEFLSLVTGIMLVIPGLPLMIVVASYLQVRSLWVVALILGVTAFAGPAVVLRSQARSLRVRDYVSAARVAGEKTPRIIGVEVLPNLLPLLASQFLFAIVLAILGEAGLSYLGLGPNGSITWGTMLNEAQGGGALTRGAWWWFVPPGLMIALFGTGLSLVNFAIDEIVNPKLRLAPAAAKSVREARKAGKDKLGRRPATAGVTTERTDVPEADGPATDQKERVDA
ncbi:ABC transporter permease [Isoptericola cucumis]|uniref:ABC transporter permease n=2 Tax=Isoptericola cucumis TaxID=1776856 RepID=A0ABQ2B312_9MICO|nr:ABC transporter permease [Isoptericola cucumis]GGI04744.1 ABC transporter permease [Isoptericola cucumis]